jgi:hypothetical protein
VEPEELQFVFAKTESVDEHLKKIEMNTLSYITSSALLSQPSTGAASEVFNNISSASLINYQVPENRADRGGPLTLETPR